MRNHLSLGLAFLLVLSWAALAAAQTGIVLGTVTDQDGNPVDSAYVTLSEGGCGGGGGGGGGGGCEPDYSTYTLDDGSYIFPEVDPDTYTAKARKMGEGMDSETVVVTAGGTFTVNFELSGCGGSGGGGGGCQHDSLEIVDVEGYAIVDTAGMCQDLYYLDTDGNGEADYRLNFGPPGYDPGSGAERPEDGDWITITGGLMEMSTPDMIIVYEINGLWWRDPMYPGGGYGHRPGGHVLAARPEIASLFPNPFNPETAISFVLPEAGQVLLAVYNLRGERVAELVNGTLAAGSHQITWNAADLASGLYLVQLQAGNATSLAKIVFTK